jgi:hypothetical protein
LHTPLPPAKIGGANDPLGGRNNLLPESFYGPNAGLTEVLIPAGYVTTVYDPVFVLSPNGWRYLPVPSNTPTILPPPGPPSRWSSAPSPARKTSFSRSPLPTKRLEPPHSAARLRPAADEATRPFNVALRSYLRNELIV